MPSYAGIQSRVVSGSLVKIFINGTPYNEAQQIQYSIDYGATEIFGIDSPYPQEVTPTKATIRGSVSGLRLKLSGGLEGYSAVFRKEDILSTPYISLRIQDRSTQEDLLFIPNAMVVSQNFTAVAKGVVSVSFSFTGLIPLEPLDRVDAGSGISSVNFNPF